MEVGGCDDRILLVEACEMDKEAVMNKPEVWSWRFDLIGETIPTIAEKIG
jgi:hypothetical protein